MTGALSSTIETGATDKGLYLYGVSATSPLAAMFGSLLRGAALTPRQSNSWLWRRSVGDTALQWFGNDLESPLSPSALRTGCAIVLDLTGEIDARDRTFRVWRLVDERGGALLEPFAWLAPRERGATTIDLTLVELDSRDDTSRRLASACLAWNGDRQQLFARLARAARDLVLEGLSSSAAHATMLPPGPRRRSRPPADTALALLTTKLHGLRRRSASVGARELWSIGLVRQPIETILANVRRCGTITLGADVWFKAADAALYWADPFEWPEHPDTVLCEEFSYRSGRGRLVALDMSRERPVATPLDFGLGGHLSYPFLFREGNVVFCLPESGEDGDMALFQLTGPHTPAQRVATVARGLRHADATLYRHGGRYWIAYTDLDIGHHDNLCLLHSERLGGPWRPHDRNPVKIDVRSARPGGTPFWIDGAFYRPAQDCSTTYGGALAVNRVLQCDAARYREETIGRINPDVNGPYPDGIHTLSLSQRGVLIDGKKYVRGPKILMAKMIERVQSLRPHREPSGRS